MFPRNDIEFLQELRQKIDSYLILGFAPSRDEGRGSDAVRVMDKALQDDPEFALLHREINQMVARGQALLGKAGIGNTITSYPAPAIGGPVRNFKLLSLVTSNGSPHRFQKNEFLDRIDQAIGAFSDPEVMPQSERSAELPAPVITTGMLFIAMPMDPNDPGLEDVHDAILTVASELSLSAMRVDDEQSNERITDRIVEALETAEFIVADLTHQKPNVYFESGHAHGSGKTPIYIARAGTTIEFDLKDYPVIFFENMVSLRKQLKERQSALIDAR